MQVVDSIKKAREKKIADHLILSEIRKQNPEKEPFFKKAEERGANATDILNEIIKQNTVENKDLKEKKPVNMVPPVTPQPPVPVTPQPSTSVTPPTTTPSSNKKGNLANSGKTILTKEAQEKEEEMRKQFLQRIEAREKGEVAEGSNFFSPPTSQETESSGEEMIDNSANETPKSKISPVLIIVIALLVLGAFILLFLNFL
jgi:cobalamin biosynthesis Mg chelatase CobN